MHINSLYRASTVTLVLGTAFSGCTRVTPPAEAPPPTGQTGGAADKAQDAADQTRELMSLKEQTGPVSSVAFSADGKRVAAAGWDPTVQVWDATTGQETLTLKGHTGWVGSVAFTPDGKRLASASSDGTVKVCDVRP